MLGIQLVTSHVTQLPLIPWLHWFHQSRILCTNSDPIQVLPQYLYYPIYKVRNTQKYFVLHRVTYTHQMDPGVRIKISFLQRLKETSTYTQQLLIRKKCYISHIIAEREGLFSSARFPSYIYIYLYRTAIWTLTGTTIA